MNLKCKIEDVNLCNTEGIYEFWIFLEGINYDGEMLAYNINTHELGKSIFYDDSMDEEFKIEFKYTDREDRKCCAVSISEYVENSCKYSYIEDYSKLGKFLINYINADTIKKLLVDSLL